LEKSDHSDGHVSSGVFPKGKRFVALLRPKAPFPVSPSTEILPAAIKGNAHVVVTFRDCLKRLRRKPVLAVLANRENLALGAEGWG
jgi:hypothetical protein